MEMLGGGDLKAFLNLALGHTSSSCMVVYTCLSSFMLPDIIIFTNSVRERHIDLIVKHSLILIKICADGNSTRSPYLPEDYRYLELRLLKDFRYYRPAPFSSVAGLLAAFFVFFFAHARALPVS